MQVKCARIRPDHIPRRTESSALTHSVVNKFAEKERIQLKELDEVSRLTAVSFLIGFVNDTFESLKRFVSLPPSVSCLTSYSSVRYQF